MRNLTCVFSRRKCHFVKFQNFTNRYDSIFTNWLRKDGRTAEHGVYRTFTFNRLCNVLKVNFIRCQTYCQNRREYRTQTLVQFPASPTPISCTTENATFSDFMKKSMYLKTDFCHIIKSGSCLWMDHKSKNVWGLIDRFVTSGDGVTLVLPFASITGQIVTRNRQNIFTGLYYYKKDIFWHCIGLISDSSLKGYPR